MSDSLAVLAKFALFVLFCIVIPWALIGLAVWGLWTVIT